MASLTRWAWVWVNSRSWWWTGRAGVLWFMGSQRVGHDWVTELTKLNSNRKISPRRRWILGLNLRPYSSTVPSNPATLLDQRWILSPNTHYHAFRKSTSQMAQAVKKPLQCSRHGRYQFHPWFNPWGHPWVGPWVRKMPWRRKWQPTPLFLPGESHEQRSLVDYSLWSRK